MTRILPDEERSELRELIQEALRAERPAMVEDVRRGVQQDLDERFEMLGLAAADHEDRAEIRKDMEFVRAARVAFRWSATKVGGSIITAAMLGLAALAGYGAWIKGWFVKM